MTKSLLTVCCRLSELKPKAPGVYLLGEHPLGCQWKTALSAVLQPLRSTESYIHPQSALGARVRPVMLPGRLVAIEGAQNCVSAMPLVPLCHSGTMPQGLARRWPPAELGLPRCEQVGESFGCKLPVCKKKKGFGYFCWLLTFFQTEGGHTWGGFPTGGAAWGSRLLGCQHPGGIAARERDSCAPACLPPPRKGKVSLAKAQLQLGEILH